MTKYYDLPSCGNKASLPLEISLGQEFPIRIQGATFNRQGELSFGGMIQNSQLKDEKLFLAYYQTEPNTIYWIKQLSLIDVVLSDDKRLYKYGFDINLKIKHLSYFLTDDTAIIEKAEINPFISV
ncbi:UNKNOWN [Stylonychia lemnae]|uniref:Uncharacterized protein n=1 Tax=Stylonychia lemnae TaxID=5949 RepID=A0A078AC73_STYLE|nr:UNKNOWN [Stylonychia lemnae]|eukprot:CDW79441.1 UNKNOWN [Stylonychia lemnae]